MGSAVIGMGFGDEGKGLVTDHLCSRNPSDSLVIRYSGGQQAGHTVYLNDKKHVFSNFGSGTLRGVPTYWTKFCTMDPVGIVNELNILLEKGIKPKLFINKDCPVTTPYDKLKNIRDEALNKHGTCGVGVGSTFEREENHYSLTFGDLFYPKIFKIKLNSVKNYYTKKYNDNIDLFLNLDYFLECCKIITNSEFIFQSDYIDVYKHKIFEGSQGLLLDQNFGFFPHVTRSNTGTKNILQIDEEPSIYLVTRAYQTRHGNGPMTNEDLSHNIKDNPEETNVTNEHQGNFRKTLLDLDLLLYAKNKDEYIKHTSYNKKYNLVITCLDHIENEYRFTYQNEIVYCNDEKDFVNKVSNILGFHDNVYISKTPYSNNITRFK